MHIKSRRAAPARSCMSALAIAESPGALLCWSRRNEAASPVTLSVAARRAVCTDGSRRSRGGRPRSNATILGSKHHGQPSIAEEEQGGGGVNKKKAAVQEGGDKAKDDVKQRWRTLQWKGCQREAEAEVGGRRVEQHRNQRTDLKGLWLRDHAAEVEDVGCRDVREPPQAVLSQRRWLHHQQVLLLGCRVKGSRTR